jgi:uncharacterized protein (TIGR04255 family)
LGAKLHQQDFQAVERLVPPGFLTLLYQPVYRYKKASEQSSILYQAGAGLFSAHGVPPYRSWDKFVPFVESGIGSLIAARDSAEKDVHFASVSLRYIDAFTKELTQGRNGAAFMAEVLGLSISLPNALTRTLKAEAVPAYALQLALPVSDEAVLNMSLAEGQVHGNDAIVMDTTVSFNKGINPDVQEIMKTLHSAHSIIHDVFVALTGPIRSLMQPTEEVAQ